MKCDDVGEHGYQGKSRWFFKNNIDRQIAIRELGWGDFNDFLEYSAHVSSDGLKANILELQWLVRTKRIDQKSGPLADIILKVLMYG